LYGSQAVSEPNFLRLCDYPALADAAERRTKTAKTVKWVGLGLALTGAAVGVSGYLDGKTYRGYGWTYWEPDWVRINVGTAIMIVGTSMAWFGHHKLQRNHVIYGQTRGLADAYNRELCRRLETDPDAGLRLYRKRLAAVPVEHR
jgi:hypothetical protein